VEAGPVYRAPMRARDRDVPPGAGAAFGLAHGVVGIGDALPSVPASLDDAMAAAEAAHGAKAGRMVARFAELPPETAVWTWTEDGFWLGRIAGPWHYDDSAAARAVGIHHVRAARWLDRPFGDDDVPPAVAATFARGGRNLQRVRDPSAAPATAALWRA
jgi:hypothetical protein